LAAGSAEGTGQLIFFRAWQAAGSALIMANNFALVTALFPREERGRAMGIAGGTVSALGYTLGPVLGGLLTHAFGWRSNFYLSAVLALVGFGAAWVLLPAESFKGSGERKKPFDFAGAVSFGLSISLLLFALALAQKVEWQTSSENLGGGLAMGPDTLALSAFLRGYRCAYLASRCGDRFWRRGDQPLARVQR
jgi:MFS family permease